MPPASETRPGTRRFHRQRMTRRGAVLLVSISVLVVLALLATVFASMAEIERNISRNYVDDVRARMLAESGIEEAISRIRQAMDRGEDLNNNNALDPGEDKNGNGRLDKSWPEVTTWWYHGEDRNANGVLDAGEDRDADGKLDTLDCKLEDALRPSFAMIDPGGPAGRARQIFIQEPSGVRPTSLCGALSVSSYGKNADQYLLKIIDTSSQIYLNDRNPNLARILNNLSFNLGGPADLGTRIVAGRPPTGFTSKYDLLTRRVITPAEFDRVKDSITAYTWMDNNVVNPVPLSEFEHTRAGSPYLVGNRTGEYWRPTSTGTYRSGQRIYRYGPNWMLPPNINATLTMGGRTDLRFCSSSGWASISQPMCLYGVDEINPQWIEATSRAPVNLNTASKEVLMSLLEGLDGFYVVERNRIGMGAGYSWLNRQDVPGFGFAQIPNGSSGSAPPPRSSPTTAAGSEIGVIYRTGPILGPAGTSSGGGRGRLAEILARKIIDYRNGRNVLPGGTGGMPNIPEGPFTSWAQFNEFCDQLLLQDGEVQSTIFEGSGVNGVVNWGPLFHERAVHAQARMDVLKANFNPNLHLNEVNPDVALFTWVDKTDLVVASTEFCFTPMGTFEIESLGRVYRPIPPTADALVGGTNVELLAEKKIATNIRVYDAVRETSQKQFFGDNPGTAPGLSRRGSTADSHFQPATSSTSVQTTTNYGYALQSGPEPDNGDAPYDNEYEGYVGLSTYGGAGRLTKPKHDIVTNLPLKAGTPSTRTTPRYRTILSTSNNPPPAPPGMGGAQSPHQEWMRAHFDYDFNLNYSQTQDTQVVYGGSGSLPWYGERRVHFARRYERTSRTTSPQRQWFNYPSPSETTNRSPASIFVFDRSNIRAPYSLADLCDGLLAPNYDGILPAQREFRIARSFRTRYVTPAGTTTPLPQPRPSDIFSANLPFHHYAPANLRADGGYIERYSAALWSPTRAGGLFTAGLPCAPVNVFQGSVS